MRGAFCAARPPERMASSTSPTGAVAASAHVGKRSRRLAKARCELTSEVCCERIVPISPLNGSSRSRGSGYP